jgi:hypothetical protein
MSKKQIDPVVKNAIDGLTKAYTETEGQTKAGRALRFILRAIPLSTIISALAHKSK